MTVAGDGNPAAALPAGSRRRALVAETAALTVSLERAGERREVLRGIDLRLHEGEILAVVGESGSGKSVLGRTLLGLLPQRSRPEVDGSVVVDGVDLLASGPRSLRRLRRERLGAVFQDSSASLNPTVRIGRQVDEASGSRSATLALLDRAGVPSPTTRVDAYPHELSGGLRQRVAIAMAVAGQPSFIVCDEPTTALDVTVQAQILELLVSLRDEHGTALFFITHDLGVAAEIADRVAVMSDGRIVEDRPTSQVIDTPSHPYTVELLRSRVCLDGPLPEAPRAEGPRAEGPDTRTGTALEATDVCVTYRQRRRGRRGGESFDALRGVTLDVGPGECLAVVGESGSGKSTLLRLLGGLEEPTSGTVERRCHTGTQMVFQDAGQSLTPWLSVAEMLTDPVRTLPRATRDAMVADVLESVGLPPEVRDARPRDLSGGQQQRVVIARAVITPPSLLLCDEPTSALDASVARSVLDLLTSIRRQLGTTMVFVTHDLAVARLVAGRVAVMREGRVVEVVAAEDLHAARDPYTRLLLSSVPGSTVSPLRLVEGLTA